MPCLSVRQRLPRPDREAQASAWAKRLRVRRFILCVLASILTAWLVGAAMSPSAGMVQRVLLWAIAVLVLIHVVMWQLEGIKLLDRMRGWPKPATASVALIALAASPMVLYPLGLIALAVSLFSGGASAPALAVSGVLLLSPIILLFLIAMMFVIGGHKRG